MRPDGCIQQGSFGSSSYDQLRFFFGGMQDTDFFSTHFFAKGLVILVCNYTYSPFIPIDFLQKKNDNETSQTP